jgi:hypothetical protein
MFSDRRVGFAIENMEEYNKFLQKQRVILLLIYRHFCVFYNKNIIFKLKGFYVYFVQI